LLESARELTTRLAGKWHGRYGMACCPAHDDRNPSLQITPGKTALLVRCYAGCDVADIFRALRAMNLDTNPTQCATSPAVDLAIRNECETARRRWHSGQKVGATVAQKYLEYRGIEDYSSFARFLPSAITFDNEKKISLPALILPITNGATIVAIQRIFLNSETGLKADIGSPKKILGKAGSGSIRLGSVESGHLYLAEGFEEAASVIKMFNVPNCWAVCGIERYHLISIPDCIRSVTVYSQHGIEAARALEKAMPHFSANNRTVEIIMPPPGKDWNDCVMASKAISA
jgi:putative DNA primase/helicase